MRIGWLMGWAVPELWFKPLVANVLPEHEHCFFEPTSAGLAFLNEPVPFDWVVGYSLGALLLLKDWGQVPIIRHKAMAPCRVALLAPIFAFCREEGLGGKISRTQVRQLLRWLRRAPGEALDDFYHRAGLDVRLADGLGTSMEDLAWGLERLESDLVRPPLPPGWCAWCGTQDPFLDAERLRSQSAEVSLVEAATHHPGALIRAFAEMLGGPK